MIEGYVRFHKLGIDRATLEHEANEWSITRGARSGRVAWQFVQDLAGRLGKPLAAEPPTIPDAAARRQRR